MTAERCAGCGDLRELRELLIVRDRHDPERPPWYCCRSSFALSRGDCLKMAAGLADDYSIALAAPDAAREAVR